MPALHPQVAGLSGPERLLLERWLADFENALSAQGRTPAEAWHLAARRSSAGRGREESAPLQDQVEARPRPAVAQ